MKPESKLLPSPFPDAFTDEETPRESDSRSATCSALSECRECVVKFALEMERELAANDHKPGWESDDPAALIQRLKDELAELEEAYWFDEQPRDCRKIVKEAADVANFAMMIADIHRPGPMQDFKCPECGCHFKAPEDCVAACPTCDWWDDGTYQQNAEVCQPSDENRS